MTIQKDVSTYTMAMMETEYGTYAVRVNKSDLTIHEMWEDVIRPLLLATGYNAETVDDYAFGKDTEI